MSGTSTATAIPSPTDPGPNSSPASASSSLYLYTFLATLVLLLGVSSAIVLRSLILRRRHRRMIAEAIANGTWLPPVTGYGARRRSKGLGEKPKVYDAALGKLVHDEDEQTEGTKKEKEKMREKPIEDLRWHDFLPVSASYLTKKPRVSTSDTPSTTSLQPTLASGRIRSYFNRSPTTPPQIPTPPATVPPSPQESDAPTHEPKKVRVAVLIAMPSRNPSPLIHKHESSEEEELPYMEFGVADLTIAPKSVDDEC